MVDVVSAYRMVVGYRRRRWEGDASIDVVRASVGAEVHDEVVVCRATVVTMRW